MKQGFFVGLFMLILLGNCMTRRQSHLQTAPSNDSNAGNQPTEKQSEPEQFSGAEQPSELQQSSAQEQTSEPQNQSEPEQFSGAEQPSELQQSSAQEQHSEQEQPKQPEQQMQPQKPSEPEQPIQSQQTSQQTQQPSENMGQPEVPNPQYQTKDIKRADWKKNLIQIDLKDEKLKAEWQKYVDKYS